MKTQLHLLVLLFLFTAFTAVSQIPNPSFENWTSSFPDNWMSNNSPPALPVIQSTDAYAGTYAARCEIINYMGFTLTPSLSATGTGGAGFPITQNHASLTGWYKGALSGGDIGYIQVGIYDSSTTPTAIGIGFVNLGNSATYQFFDAPIYYFGGGTAAYATIFISVLDTSGITQGTVGSYITVDDLSFTAATNISTVKNGLSLEVLPNPVSDKLNLKGEFKSGKIYNLKLFSAIGKLVKDENKRSSSGELPAMDLSLLPEGNYILTVSDGEESSVKKIIISR